MSSCCCSFSRRKKNRPRFLTCYWREVIGAMVATTALMQTRKRDQKVEKAKKKANRLNAEAAEGVRSPGEAR
jgi:hypothetical protein